MTTADVPYREPAKRPQWGSRLARFHALRLASRRFPALQKRMPFCSEARRLLDEGVIVEHFEEEQTIALTELESAVAKRLPNTPVTHFLRSVALVRLENVTLLGNTGKLIDERRGVLLRARREPLAVEINDFRAEVSRPVQQPNATYVNFMGEHSGHAHFFHFFFDRLPRLHYLLERFSLGREPLIVLTNENPPAFQRDIFKFVADRYPNVRFQQIPHRERWHLPAIHCVDDYQSTTRSTLPREAVDFMRSLIVGGYGLEPGPARRRIYITRGDARKRRLRNESELLPLFEAKKFQVVAAANLSFRDQIALFCQASAIAGAHGAGLSHILFAPAGAHVLEIFPADRAHNIDFFYLAKVAGGTYDAVLGSKGDRLSWFRADPADIGAALDRL